MTKYKLIDGYSVRGYLSYQSKQIRTLIQDGKYSFALNNLILLLQQYPDDVQLKKLMASCYIALKDYDKAIELLEDFPLLLSYATLTSLYMKTNQNEKLYDLYQKIHSDKNFELLLDPDFEFISHCLKTLFEKDYVPNLDKITYHEKQFFQYDEKLALNHIHIHHNNPENRGFFLENINIEDLFYQIKQFIENHLEEAAVTTRCTEQYIFYVESCGKNMNQLTNYVSVFTFVGTSNILTMYPILLEKKFHICHLEKQMQVKEKEKVKAKSGIERFYQRYNQ